MLQDGQCLALPCLCPHPLQSLDAAGGEQPPAAPLQAGEGDILLMFDASWYVADPWPAVDALLHKGVRLCGMLHDLLPLDRPEWFRPGLQPLFSAHFQALVQRAERLFVPSMVVRERLVERLRGIRPELPVDLLPHGGDFHTVREIPDDHPQLRSLPAPSSPASPLYLVLGTLEPRKNHERVLDAFDRLWAQGFAGRLLFVGQVGWQVDELLQRIECHPRLGSQLFHASRLSDPALYWLLGKVAGLIYLSRDEGFGLPVLEAAMRGCPVIASDIPVLREVGGSWARYVGPDDTQGLVQAVSALSSAPPQYRPQRTWSDVALRLADCLAMSGSAAHVIP